MAKYQIFTDSSSDLTPELRKQHNLEYFYFGLVVDGVEYRADIDWKAYTAAAGQAAERKTIRRFVWSWQKKDLPFFVPNTPLCPARI